MAKEHVIIAITNDRDRVRKRPTIYIPDTGKLGAEHVVFEIIDNALDELTANVVVGSEVTVEFDNKTKVCKVTDTGGGIPHDGLVTACSVINASGKFENGDDSHFGASGGINGVGLKLSNFLSEWCTVTSMFKGKKLTCKFVDGVLESQEEEKTKDHGTIVEFKLSQQFVDVKSLDVKDLITRLEEKSYLFPNIKMTMIVTENGKEKSHKVYTGQTIMDRVKQWKPDTGIFRVQDTRTHTLLDNITDENLTKKKVTVDVAFAMKEAVLDTNDQMEYIIAYGNTIKNYMGGAHVEGLRQGIVKYFQKVVIPKLKGKDKDLPIMPSDITAGLCAFIIAKVYEPEFRGQYKDQLSNQEVRFVVRDAVFDALCEAKPGEVNPMIEFVKRVTRGRLASKKTRKKDVSNAFSKDRLEKFKDIVYNLNTDEPELILVEGDSAADNAATARDPYNQAIYGIKRPKNIFDTPTEQVAKIKSTFNDVLDICGIEPGKKCEPEKSTMARILMLTDGDVDGDDIAISTVGLLAKHCKPLIDAGMVGRILPPAYSIPVGNGKSVYVRSQREFFDKITKQFIKNETVSYKGKEMTKKELREFIAKNFEYDTRLEKLANRYCVDAKVMEYIAWYYHGTPTDQKKSYWMKVLKRYPGVQILIEGGILVFDGDIKGADYINIPLDEHFHKHVMRFKEYQKVNSSIDGYEISGKKDLTLYDVMHAIRKNIPKGVKRFKGLGELEPHEMRELCMDKKSRTVVIFKFSDFEKDMDKMNIIMSTKAEYAASRKDIMFSLRSDDLDIDT